MWYDKKEMPRKKRLKKETGVKDLLGQILADLCLIGGFLIILLIFGLPLGQEIKYEINRFRKIRYEVMLPGSAEEIPAAGKTKAEKIIPESFDFGIVIPKIGANAKVFPRIDPFNKNEFLPILRKGVAHAQGSSLPGQGGNIYLFAHSTDAFFNAGRYNAVFYLIGKLENGDEIDVFYKNKLYRYSVFEKKVVEPQAVQYLWPTKEETLTLQTCYPPGTTLKRLIVRANPKK